jgi:peptidoglycan-N-acetylglucosamine deacetylase
LLRRARILAPTALVALAGLAAAPAVAPARLSSLDLVRADLRQAGPDLVLRLRTAQSWSPSDLSDGSLCLELHGRRVARICATGTRRIRLRYEPLGAGGAVLRSARLAARVTRHDPSSFRAMFALADAHLGPGELRWRAFSSPRTGCAGPGGPTPSCDSSFPASGLAALRIRRPKPIGCTRHGAPFRTNGSRRHRTVAMTFDDGPSPYTHRVLRILRRFRVPATFFLIGQQVGPFRREARAELRAGNEIGNHSLRHSFLPSRGDLATTNRVIRRATGFRPCLFRPPGGDVNSRLVGSALSLGMDTITWDVDPRDWSRPGTGAIVTRVLGAVRPGSIVLMHDGGGPRGETVAALPTILRVLRHRGYRFETVSALLGDKLVWLPGHVRL